MHEDFPRTSASVNSIQNNEKRTVCADDGNMTIGEVDWSP